MFAVPPIGIDLGGTKIEAVALGPDGEVLIRRRVPTPAGRYEATLDAIADLVHSIERDLGVNGSIGIGTPGTVSGVTGRIINANSVVLNGKPLLEDLQARLGRPVRIENDANCFALSEATDGAGAAGRVVFGVILGTGVGGGIVADKRLWPGRNGIAGEWGHNPLPWSSDAEVSDRPCYCGRMGCIETFLSGGGLSRTYEPGPARPTPREIADRAARGEAAALVALDLYRDQLARSLAHLINILDPDIVVLGGGVSNIAAIRDGLGGAVGRYIFSDAVRTPIVPARHGDSSGVRGAAWLWSSPSEPASGLLPAH